MKVVNIKFVDFWPGFDHKENVFIEIISRKYTIVHSESPDYLIYSAYGNDHLQYNCIKIFYTAENLVPDFNLCDYAIGFHFINFQDRYVRIPLCVLTEPIHNRDYKSLLNNKNNHGNLLNRKFCNFIYSNIHNADPFRINFLEKLSKYKTVDCGGVINNNVGGLIKDKMSFISEYKFTIAFENSSVDGYTTEKIVEPMLVNSIPIYWGNRKINLDFNINSFVFVYDSTLSAVNEAIERVIALDQDDNKYLEMCNEPFLTYKQYINYEEPLFDFLDNIMSQPIEYAYRRAFFGANKYYLYNLKTLIESNKEDRVENKNTNLLLKKLINKKNIIKRYFKV